MNWSDVPAAAVSIFQSQPEAIREFYKTGEAAGVGRLGQFLQLWPGHTVGSIPNSPAPLASMLVGGLAGAGLGYGAGALGEHFLPANWQRHRLRRTLAMLGGLAGASPGMLWAGTNLSRGKPLNDASQISGPAEPAQPKPSQFQIADGPGIDENMQKEIDRSLKQADYMGETGAMGIGAVDVNEFNQLIWKDPMVSQQLSPTMRAAATGLITGSANLPGKSNSSFVTPYDVGRMAAGLGAGYMSGSLVGTGLGILMGMSPQAQNTLKSTGAMAGLISQLIPRAFLG